MRLADTSPPGKALLETSKYSFLKSPPTPAQIVFVKHMPPASGAFPIPPSYAVSRLLSASPRLYQALLRASSPPAIASALAIIRHSAFCTLLEHPLHVASIKNRFDCQAPAFAASTAAVARWNSRRRRKWRGSAYRKRRAIVAVALE
jgi:hypothetical protein